MTLLTHALAALLFAVLALARWRSGSGVLPRGPLVVALALTGFWALGVAGVGGRDVATRLANGAATIAWLVLALAIRRRLHDQSGSRSVVAVAIAGMVAIAAVIAVAIAIAIHPSTAAIGALNSAFSVGRMLAALALLFVIHAVHSRLVARSDGAARMVLLCVAVLALTDLLLAAATWWWSALPDGALQLRGVALVLMAPLIALAIQRDREWTLQVSRTVAYQTAMTFGVAGCVVGTSLATAWIGSIAGEHARVAQTAFVFGATAALLTLGSTPWLRAWTKVIVAKHFFRHRHDYRTQWTRFTQTLGSPQEGPASLETRVVKAVADLVDAPAGLLLTCDGETLLTGSGWRWDLTMPSGTIGTDLTKHLRTSRRIIDVDAVRRGTAPAAERDGVPAWISTRDDLWAIVPLLHFGSLTGAVVLSRPPLSRALDWEDFDLLSVAGRQAASYLAEARAQEGLAQAQRFDEFNRRFAFIMHDLKNLVSQLSLTARNAERHADNPAFRADMIATLTDSAARMTSLLARLSQRGGTLDETPRAIPVGPVLDGVAVAKRVQHPVVVQGDTHAWIQAAPNALDTLLGHLVQNAIDATDGDVPVMMSVHRRGEAIAVSITDCGRGMTPAFVRDTLFRPFASEKNGGFGLGAFEARQLAEAMGGRVTVDSRVGEGTCFTVTLPAAQHERWEEAA